MKITAIGDHTFTSGFRLAGADAVVAEGSELEKAVREIARQDDAGILIITEETLQSLPRALAEQLTESSQPVVVIIGEGYMGPLREKTKKILGIDIYSEMNQGGN